METIKNGIIEGITNGTYNIISKNNAGYIDINYINIHEPPDLQEFQNNIMYKTMKTKFGPFTLYQQNKYGLTLSFDWLNDEPHFFTVFPQ